MSAENDGRALGGTSVQSDGLGPSDGLLIRKLPLSSGATELVHFVQMWYWSARNGWHRWRSLRRTFLRTRASTSPEQSPFCKYRMPSEGGPRQQIPQPSSDGFRALDSAVVCVGPRRCNARNLSHQEEDIPGGGQPIPTLWYTIL